MPSGGVDASGNIYTTYYAGNIPSSSAGTYLFFRVVDSNGITVHVERPLTDGPTAVTTGQVTLPDVLANGSSVYTIWTDNRRGISEVVLRIVGP